MTGHFIVLEGIEGCGKSSVSEHLKSWLAENHPDREVVHIREPGGTGLGEALRDIILHSEHAIHPEAELLMFYAGRKQLLEDVIRPALERGAIVIGERHSWSTLAYQGVGRKLGLERVKELHDAVMGDFAPSLTILLDVEAEVGLTRAGRRGELDRIERESLEFFRQIRLAFLSLADRARDESVIIPDAPLPEVLEGVSAAVAGLVASQG